jgi:ABC-type nitrate/sulfonate/bicarbonate transport system substrate-binding protein
MQVSRRRVALPFLLIFLASLAHPAFSQPLKLETVKIAYSNPGMPIFSLMLAREIGYFREEQLNVEPVMMTSALSGLALASGDLDYTTMIGQLIGQAVSGSPVKVVFVNVNRPMFVFVGRPEIKSVKDLKGKPVGVGSHGAIDDALARRVIAAGGLSPEKDVTILALGSTSNRLGALIAGSISATMLTAPFNLKAERQGFNRLAMAGDYMQPVTNGLGVSEKRIKERPEQIKRLLRAMLRSQDYLQAHKEESVQKAIAWYKFDREAAELSYDMLVRSMPPKGLAPDESFRAVIDSSKARAPSEIPVSRVADMTLLREVLKEWK